MLGTDLLRPHCPEIGDMTLDQGIGVASANVLPLADLLFRLVERAGTNAVRAIGERKAPSINNEFARLRHAAHNIEIAPGIMLSRLLFTRVSDLHSDYLFERLRSEAANWPDGSEPRAYWLTYATSVSGCELRLSIDNAVQVASRVEVPRASPTEAGPYLVLVEVAFQAPARSYAATRAYAQPIHNGRYFVPIDTPEQRTLLAVLLELQWRLRNDQVSTWISRPVFEISTDVGPRRPDFMLASYHRREQQSSLQLIELVNSDKQVLSATPTSFDKTPIDGIVRINADRLGDLDGLTRDLVNQLRRPPPRSRQVRPAAVVNLPRSHLSSRCHDG